MAEPVSITKSASRPAAPLPAAPALARAHDGALLEAEREIAQLWTEAAKDVVNDVPAQILDRVAELNRFIADAHAVSAVGAAVKLRRLLSEDMGMQHSRSKLHVPLATSALTAIEREISRRAAVLPTESPDARKAVSRATLPVSGDAPIIALFRALKDAWRRYDEANAEYDALYATLPYADQIGDGKRWQTVADMPATLRAERDEAEKTMPRLEELANQQEDLFHEFTELEHAILKCRAQTAVGSAIKTVVLARETFHDDVKGYPGFEEFKERHTYDWQRRGFDFVQEAVYSMWLDAERIIAEAGIDQEVQRPDDTVLHGLAAERQHAVGGPDDPELIALGQRIADLHVQCRDNSHDDETVERLSDESLAIEQTIIRTPARSAAGMAVKLRILAEMAGLIEDVDRPMPPLDPDADRYNEDKLLLSLWHDAERLAGKVAIPSAGAAKAAA